jgi:hypothetical protein
MSARPGPCGGQPAAAVPTAIANHELCENEGHAYSPPALPQRTRVLLFALPDETQGKITSPETGNRQGLGGPDLEGVAERCGRDEGCSSEGVGGTSTRRTPASMGARTEEKSQASCQGRCVKSRCFNNHRLEPKFLHASAQPKRATLSAYK